MLAVSARMDLLSRMRERVHPERPPELGYPLSPPPKKEEDSPLVATGIINPHHVDTALDWKTPSANSPMRTEWKAPPPWALQDTIKV